MSFQFPSFPLPGALPDLRLLRPRARARLIFAVLPLLYLAVLGGVVVYRSSARSSVLTALSKDLPTLPENTSDQSASVTSKLLLEDFHRIEVKNGRPVWEVRAKDAKYYPKELVIHVNQVSLKIFRDKRADVMVRSEAAKLYRSESSLNRAVLDGNISIETGDGMFIDTDSAEFDALAKIFQSPGVVTVRGNGYSVKGEGFRFFVESGIVLFSKNVHCTFEPGAKIPQDLHVAE